MYYVRFWDPDAKKYRPAISSGERRKDAATRWADAQLAVGIIGQKENPTIAALCAEQWADGSQYLKLKTLRGKPLAEATVTTARALIRLHVVPFPPFGVVRISEARARLFEDWFSWMQERGIGAPSIVRAWATIRGACSWWAARNGRPNPCKGIETVSYIKQEKGILSTEEIAGVLAAPYADPRRVGVLLGLLAGLRIGEVRGLRWGDVDLERGIVHVTQQIPSFKHDPVSPKWKSSGGIIVPRILCGALAAWRDASPYPDPGDYIVPAPDGGPVGTQALINGFKKLLALAGIPEEGQRARRLSFHSLRHTFASLARGSGLPDFVVQGMTRHKTSAMLDNYSHVGIIDIEKRRKSLDKTIPEKKLQGRKIN